MTSAHRRAVRHAEEQAGLCHWCGRPMRLAPFRPGGAPEPWSVSLEHLRSKGDPMYHRDTAAAHVLCNVLRGVLPPPEFIAYVHSAEFGALYRRTFGRRRSMASPKLKGVIRQIARREAPARRICRRSH